MVEGRHLGMKIVWLLHRAQQAAPLPEWLVGALLAAPCLYLDGINDPGQVLSLEVLSPERTRRIF
ncbi:hypothetical protein NITHO_950006 [Nitrolancea hollandica Lb]|uniref:Uncharacterized protein n=1 Tax=Nitrolancea hollandica Lb TaxID=1129897 RepID=I4ENJ8_9BACT|nr:hypothetical protein NITHO_950006 [Nitrolancea hollandica Lb]